MGQKVVSERLKYSVSFPDDFPGDPRIFRAPELKIALTKKSQPSVAVCRQNAPPDQNLRCVRVPRDIRGPEKG